MNAWTFVMKDYFFDEIKNREEIPWNSPKDIKNGDIIFVYSTSPKKYIDYILKANNDPYINPDKDSLYVDVEKVIEIPHPVELQELRDNTILSEWSPINKKKFIFQGAHHKMSEQQCDELKRLIIEKNPQLKEQIENLGLNDFTIKAINALKIKRFEKIIEKKVKGSKENYKKFIDLYPFNEFPDKINSINPDDIYNPGNKSYFLYFIEFGLKECGHIRVGQALYAENARENIDKFKKLLKNTVDKSLSVAEKVDAPWEEISYFGGDKLIAKKIIFCYNPSKILPIYKTEHLEYFSAVINEDFKSESNRFNKKYSDLTLGEKFEYLNEIILTFKNEVIKSDMDNVSFSHFLYHLSHPDGVLENMEFNVWKIAPGSFEKRKQMWPVLTEKGYIGVGWFGCESLIKRDYSNFNSIEEIQKEILKCSNMKSPHPTDKMIWNFAKEIQIGDYVVSNNGYNGVLGVGIIKSDYIGPEESEKLNIDEQEEYFHYRKVDWLITEEIKVPGRRRFFQQQTIEKLDDKKWNKIKEIYSNKNPKYKEILDEPIIVENYESLFLKPQDIETDLIINYNILEQICGTLNSNKHIMLTGAPGTGKTDLSESICRSAHKNSFSNGYILTTATSDWTTFDTIGGYMPDESGRLIFEEGKFLQAIREDKWLIIDEINRADIDKAFGQLFTVLSGQGVDLPFKISGRSIRIQPTEEIGSYYDSETATYFVGKNWRILSTMNVYDKDYLFEMSYAFMRRFTFIYIDLPVLEEYKALIDGWCGDLDASYIQKIHQLLDINPHREIGPAIFKDVVEYVVAREEIVSTEHILEDAVLSFIMPQFEGLEKTQILEIWKILKSIFTDSAELKNRLEEISTIPLDDSK